MRGLVLAIFTIAIFTGCQAEKSRVAVSTENSKVETVSSSSEIPRALRKKYKTEKRFALVIGNNDHGRFILAPW